MSTIFNDLGDYVSFNANASFDISTLDGELLTGVGITQVFSDGILVALEAPAVSPRRYIPLNAIAGVDVTEDLTYQNPPPPEE